MSESAEALIDKMEQVHAIDNNEYYKFWAEYYPTIVRSLNRLRREVVEKMKDALGESVDISGVHILDMACGEGSQACEFAQNGFSTTAVDLSPDMLAKAEKNKLKREEGGDILPLQFDIKDGTNTVYVESFFDASTTSLALHDMPPEIARKVIEEIKRVTKENAPIIFVDHNDSPSKWYAKIFKHMARIWETEHYWNFVNNGGLKRYLEDAGLDIVGSKEVFMGTMEMVEVKNTK